MISSRDSCHQRALTWTDDLSWQRHSASLFDEADLSEARPVDAQMARVAHVALRTADHLPRQFRRTHCRTAAAAARLLFAKRRTETALAACKQTRQVDAARPRLRSA